MSFLYICLAAASVLEGKFMKQFYWRKTQFYHCSVSKSREILFILNMICVRMANLCRKLLKTSVENLLLSKLMTSRVVLKFINYSDNNNNNQYSRTKLTHQILINFLENILLCYKIKPRYLILESLSLRQYSMLSPFLHTVNGLVQKRSEK